MSDWSQEMVVRKVPSVPVISSVSVSPGSQGDTARLLFKTDNYDLCHVKLIGENEVISEPWDSAPTCRYQERFITFSLASLPCEDHRVSVRCRNKVQLDKVIIEMFQAISVIL